MPRRFKDVKEMLAATDAKGALEAAKALVHHIEGMGYQPPEVWPQALAGTSALLDAVAARLCIDSEIKRVVSEFFVRVNAWMDNPKPLEITIKPIGNGMIAYCTKAPGNEAWPLGSETWFETPARYFLPHLGRALVSDPPADPNNE